MFTFEYPYNECTHPAQIYKKVISGKKPDAFYKVRDPEVRQFVEKCLATVSLRLSARELLEDPFLRVDDYKSDLRSVEYGREVDLGHVPRELHLYGTNKFYNSNDGYRDPMNDYGYGNEWGFESNGIELFEYQDDDDDNKEQPSIDVGIITIKGKRGADGNIFLRLRIADKEGRIGNIYFSFDTETDTAMSLATEMVAELDINDQDVTKIAGMINDKISSLVPEWRGEGLEQRKHLGS